jgi:hypothetical protein
MATEVEMRKWYIPLVLLLVGVAWWASPGTAAQEPQQFSLTFILRSIQDTLRNLVTSVNNLNTAVAEGNVAFTPTVLAFPPDKAVCSAVNVSAATHSVNLQAINGSTGAVLLQGTGTVDPGHTIVFSVLPLPPTSPPPLSQRVFCRIEVIDGVKSDVRGALALASSGSDRDPIAAQ